MGKKLNHFSNLISDGWVEKNSALKRQDYGSICNAGNVIGNNGFYIWHYMLKQSAKTHKRFKGKGRPLRGLQSKLMH